MRRRCIGAHLGNLRRASIAVDRVTVFQGFNESDAQCRPSTTSWLNSLGQADGAVEQGGPSSYSSISQARKSPLEPKTLRHLEVGWLASEGATLFHGAHELVSAAVKVNGFCMSEAGLCVRGDLEISAIAVMIVGIIGSING